jgi:hypothetical protein
MKKGHKEYRIFSNINIKDETEYENQLEIWRKDKTYVEERIDLYIFPLNTENDINKRFGLKFRNISIKNDNFSANKLELKIRNDRSTEGIENWSKIIQEKFNHFNILTFINNSDIYEKKNIIKIKKNYYLLNLGKTLETIKGILSEFNTNEVINYSKSFENFPYGFVITFKNRSGETYGEDVMMKSYYFEVNETENVKIEAKLSCKRSLCVEYTVNSNYIENLNNKLEDYTVTGYPEELSNLFIHI